MKVIMLQQLLPLLLCLGTLTTVSYGQVSFPRGSSCRAKTPKTYMVDFQSIKVESSTYTRYLTGGLACLLNSDRSSLNATDKINCAILAKKEGYNSFTYERGRCTGFSYYSKSCMVEPPPKRSGTDIPVYIIDKPLSRHQAYISEFAWKKTKPGNMAATITMHNHCQVTKIAVELLNNGTVIVFPKTKSTELIEFEVDSPTCTDQDIKIILENEQGQNMYSKNFRRNLCRGDEIDFCNVCARSRSESTDETFTKTLKWSKKRDGYLPTVTNEDQRDMLIHIAETNEMGPFWIDLTRESSDDTFKWPDGSTDISQFGNAGYFDPTAVEHCAVAYVDVVTMQLMVEPKSCKATYESLIFFDE